MRNVRVALAGLCLALCIPALAADKTDMQKYQETISTFKQSAVGQKYFATAYGYAVFPTIGKGGLGIGGGGGSGGVFEGGVLIGKSSTFQVSIGLQAGGQAYSQVIFLEDKRAFDEFTSGNFEFGADASAIAITAGANASAGTTGTSASANTGSKDGGAAKASYNKGIAVITLAKGGLMYQAAIAGQKYNFEKGGGK
jgi:lipid-binding SYLF domain-containing protein